MEAVQVAGYRITPVKPVILLVIQDLTPVVRVVTKRVSLGVLANLDNGEIGRIAEISLARTFLGAQHLPV
jgi:hypothetical protein